MLQAAIRILVLTAVSSAVLPAQEKASSAAVVAGGRSMSRALNGVLGGQGRTTTGERTLFLLVDPTTSLVDAGFVDELEYALKRNSERLTAVRIGVARVGSRPVVTLKPGNDHSAVVREVAKILAKPSSRIRNVYQDIRAVVMAFDETSGRRELVLVSLDNGDAEDQVEATVTSLRKRGIRFLCITRESYLSDTYWAARPYERAPRKCKLTGGDGPFVELPWGWLFQVTVANEVAPSGTANYPLSRLAAATGGRAHLYSPSGSGHECAVYGSCLFCSDDHSPASEMYWKSRLMTFSATTASRSDAYRAAAADPAFRAMLRAWKRASRAGLLRSMPSVKLAGDGLTPQRPRPGRLANLFGSTSFSRLAARAMKLTKECDQIRIALEKELASQDRSKSIPRYRAMAAYTAVMFQLTRTNLVGFHGWCREIAPGVVSKSPPTLEPPEVDRVNRTRRPSGVGFRNYSLCHGVRPFLEIELPGGKAFRKELLELEPKVRSFKKRFGHAPFVAALHRCGIAHFHVTYPGVARGAPRKRPNSKDKEAATERGRPPRPGRSSGGGTGGTTGK